MAVEEPWKDPAAARQRREWEWSTHGSGVETLKSKQNDEEWNRKFQLNLEKAKRHVRFCCSLYRLQSEAG